MLFYLFIQKRRQRQRKEEEKDEDKEEEEDDILWGRQHVCKLRYMSWHGIEWKENVDQVKMQVAVLLLLNAADRVLKNKRCFLCTNHRLHRRSTDL